MEKAFQDVSEFHYACNIPIGNKPIIIPDERAILRIDLIKEEVSELVNAIAAKKIIDIADACADICYVVIGTAIEYGIPLDRVLS
jgi:predicted HAD superfamily Cof-like phosphohydrolase